VLVVVLE